ncbi:MAG: hypothetical protein BWY66_00539 [bacterium ADurb.Bin374]|nr:MAG: hypothetical protein BWY66_00539 [bacterium ADurb.Bin374]
MGEIVEGRSDHRLHPAAKLLQPGLQLAAGRFDFPHRIAHRFLHAVGKFGELLRQRQPLRRRRLLLLRNRFLLVITFEGRKELLRLVDGDLSLCQHGQNPFACFRHLSSPPCSTGFARHEPDVVVSILPRSSSDLGTPSPEFTKTRISPRLCRWNGVKSRPCTWELLINAMRIIDRRLGAHRDTLERHSGYRKPFHHSVIQRL